REHDWFVGNDQRNSRVPFMLPARTTTLPALMGDPVAPEKCPRPPQWRPHYAYRADFSPDRGRPAETLRRNGAGHLVADRRTGVSRPRCHAVRQRRFRYESNAFTDVAASVAP